jgi:hypothetical protein
MGWRGTAALLLLLGATAVVAYRDAFSDTPHASWSSLIEDASTPPGGDIQRLLDFSPTQVVALTVQRGGPALSAERTADGWSGGVRPKGVDDFVAALAKLAVILQVQKDSPLEAFGLDPPWARIVLRSADGTTLSLDLGDHNPSSTAVYARLGDSSRITLTGAVIRWEIENVLTVLAAEKTTPGAR